MFLKLIITIVNVIAKTKIKVEGAQQRLTHVLKINYHNH